jgi:hypothetical protein
MASNFRGQTSGMTKDDKAVNMVANQPIFGFSNTSNPSVIIKNINWRNSDLSMIDNANTDPMRRNTIITNNGGLRGVLPCKGLASIGLVPGDRTILKRPAESQLSGIYPTPIPAARHLPDGLLTQPQYKRHPLMVPADCFNAGMMSSLGVPA